MALGTPAELRATVGGDSITIATRRSGGPGRGDPPAILLPHPVLDGSVRLEQPNGHQWIARLVEAFPGQIDAVTLGKPTLEDVFIDRTGHRFWTDQTSAAAG